MPEIPAASVPALIAVPWPARGSLGKGEPFSVPYLLISPAELGSPSESQITSNGF